MSKLRLGISAATVFALTTLYAPAALASAPVAPSGVQVNNSSPANTSLSSSQATVSWTGSAGAIGYEVVATSSTGPTVSTYVPVNANANTSYSAVFGGLLGGVGYNFVVTAINTDGKTSAASVSDIPQSVPDTPTGLVATPGAKQAALVWAAPSNTGGLPLTGYIISTLENAGKTYSESASSTSATITGLQDGSSYTFQIVAVNSNGDSVSTQAQKITTPSVPDSPSGVSGSVSGSTVTLTWSPPAFAGNSAITGYSVHIFDSANTELSNLATNSLTASATINSIPAGSYTAKVSATNVVGTSALSDASNIFLVTASSSLTANSPVITPQRIADQNVGASVAISATAPSGGAVNLTVSPSTVCTYSGTTGLITIVNPGVCTVVATTPATASYAAGSSSLSFNVLKLSQSINFDAIPPQNLPGPLTLHATSTSGSAVDFSTSGTCAVSGSTLSFSGVGACTVTANAPSTDVYNAANSVTQTFAISAAVQSQSSGGGGGGSVVVVPLPAPTPSASPKPSATPTPSASPSPSASVKPTPISSASSLPTPLVSPTPVPSTSKVATVTPNVPAPKVIATGIKEYANQNVAGESQPTVSKLARSLSTAPIVAVSVGKIFAPQVPGLPKAQAITATLTIGNKKIALGAFKTNTSGLLHLPGLNLAKAGTYTIALKTSKGITYYIKLVVKAKK